MRRVLSLVTVLSVAFLLWGQAGAARRGTPAQASQATKAKVLETYGKLPLHFEVNRGQTDPQVKFLSRGKGYTLYLTPTEAVLSLNKPQAQGKPGKAKLDAEAKPPKTHAAVLRMKLLGANPDPEIVGLDRLPGESNYFIGNDPKKWRTNIPHYAKVEYRQVYPGIDLIYYGNQRRLEYDFVVAPGADPRAIKLAFQGADHLTLDAHGNLILHIADGEVILRTPVIYQEVGGIKRSIGGSYILKGKHQVGFQVAAYDATQPLVIDPVLRYSTYLGGGGRDFGRRIAVDASGNAYVTGDTRSIDFPTASPIQADSGGDRDVFVTKLNAAGSALVYSTYLGGNGDDIGFGIAVDASRNAYVTGRTGSPGDFPTTEGAFQTAFGGGTRDGFVVKLNVMGSALVYSTYLGGSSSDEGRGIAVDTSGKAYATGFTNSTDFPGPGGTIASKLGPGLRGGSDDAFVTKLNAAGSELLYSTYLGGSGRDRGEAVAVDADGNAYVTGNTISANFPTTAGAFDTTCGTDGNCDPTDGFIFFDAFVTKLNAAGSELVYSTFLGGSGGDPGRRIAVDASGNTYVTGFTSSSADFPTTAGAIQTDFGGGTGDAFVTKLNATGSALVYSTYLGGNDEDGGRGIAVDAFGSAYVTGGTGSDDFPIANPIQAVFGEGDRDVFVAKLNLAGSALVYSTYLGGGGREVSRGIAVDAKGNAYVTGFTGSTDFPTTDDAFQSDFGGGGRDAFVAKIAVTAKGLKEGAISELDAVKAAILAGAPGVGNVEDAGENLDDAIAFLQASLASFQRDDDFRLIVALGEAFFDNEENGVEEIFDAIDSGEITDPTLLIELQNIVVNKILEADKIVAETAIDDALGASGNPDDIADAQAEFATAQQQVADGVDAGITALAFFDDAVGSFEDAWINAQQAVGALSD